MKTNSLPYILLAFAATYATATAEDLKTEITVERTITPAERAASRLPGVSPTIYTPDMTPMKLAPVEYTAVGDITRSIVRLDPAAHPGYTPLSPYRGYASIGYFPSYNLGASAGYRFINTDRSRLGAWLQFDGSSYGDYRDGSYGFDKNFRDNTVSAGLDFNHRVGSRSHLKIAASYSYAALYNPAINNEESDSHSQGVSRFNAAASWWSREGRLVYHVGAGVDLFDFTKDTRSSAIIIGGRNDTMIPGAVENTYTFNAGAAWLNDVGDAVFGIRLTGDIHHVGRGLSATDIYAPGTSLGWKRIAMDHRWNTAGTFGIMPYYNFDFFNVRGYIGLNINYNGSENIGNEGLYLMPDVLISWAPNTALSFYAKIKSETVYNSLGSLYDYSPFMSSMFVYERAICSDGEFGVNIGPIHGASLKLWAGIASADNWAMPAYTNMTTEHGGKIYDAHMFRCIDFDGYRLGARIDYQWRDMVKAYGSIEVVPHEFDEGYYMWRDRANVVAQAGLTVKPVDKLDINVDYLFRGGRTGYAVSEYTIDSTSLGTVNSLSLGASWRFSDRFSVYARGENLFNHHSDIFIDIPMQGVRGLAGVAYKF